MARIAAILAAAVFVVSPAFAVDLPDNVYDRAVACSVYGAWAPPGDARSGAAKSAIESTIESALAQGIRTREQVNETFHETTSLALYDDPRDELVANWNECRDSFAPL